MFKVPNNSLVAMRQFVVKELTDLYGEREATSLFKIACEAYLKLPYNKPMPNVLLSESDILKFFSLCKRLKQEEPIQYILGYTEFYGLKIGLSPAVLIPRPETEELVHHALQLLQNQPSPTVVDLCTGSGCIALAIKANVPQSTVCAVEWSDMALKQAINNAANLNLDLNFHLADVLDVSGLSSLFKEGSVQMLLSNPPYIEPQEMSSMSGNVLRYEPHMALFTPSNDPLLFYNKIAEFAHWSLSSEGIVMVEINEAFSSEVCKIFEQRGFVNIVAIKDINEKFRIVKANKA